MCSRLLHNCRGFTTVLYSTKLLTAEMPIAAMRNVPYKQGSLYNLKSAFGSKEMTLGKRESGSLGLLRAAGLIAVAAGAVGSAGLTLYAGRHNPSRILMGFFVLWVLSPFAALVLANVVSRRWTVPTRAALYIVMLVLTLGTLATYGRVALGPPRAQTAFAFVVVPPASWLLIAIVAGIAAIGRRS